MKSSANLIEDLYVQVEKTIDEEYCNKMKP